MVKLPLDIPAALGTVLLSQPSSRPGAGCCCLSGSQPQAPSEKKRPNCPPAPPCSLPAPPRGLSVTPDSIFCGLFFQVVLSLTAKHSQHPWPHHCFPVSWPVPREGCCSEMQSWHLRSHTRSHSGRDCSLGGFAQGWIAKPSCLRNILGSGDFSVSRKEPHRVPKINHTPSSLVIFLGNSNKLPEQRGNPRMCEV